MLRFCIVSILLKLLHDSLFKFRVTYLLTGMKGEYPNTTVGFVHINDVVAAHLLAMEDPKASGRLICSSTVAHWSQIIEMLRAKYPSYPYENE